MQNPLRIAYFSPLPPERSGIADYSRELLPYLARKVALVLYTQDPVSVTGGLKEQFDIRELDRFQDEHSQFDLALYQMGNSEYHTAAYATLLQYPGLVVLHDYLIHHFIAHRTRDQGNFAGYAREMGYALGVPGMRLAHAIRLGQAPSMTFEVALNERLLDSSLGFIVHSQFVAEKIRQRGLDQPLAIIPALVEQHSGVSRRQRLRLADDVLLLASFGLITKQKQIEMALRAFQMLRHTIPNSHYLLVGEVLPEVNLDAVISELDLGGAVTKLGYLPELQDFIDWLHTADVIVNLREPTVGETSATALRAMAAGRPLIVFDQGWYREIPAAAAIKIAPLDEEMLLSAMIRLAESPQVRQQMGQAGQRYTRENCHPAAIADAYTDALVATIEWYSKPHE
jgi:glycosyltransferase involved in cell wall biosynthesis